MLHTEWSLVFFTTIAQLAAGIMIAVLPFVFVNNSSGYNQDGNVYAKDHNGCAKLNHTALYFAAGLMLVALALSFFHLNNPVNAFYALSNLETSWLSREILMVSLFLFSLVLVGLILYFRNLKVIYYRTFLLGTTVVGFIMVFSMSKLYMIPTVPPWSSISTIIAFYSTVLLLGAAFVLGLYFHQFHRVIKTNAKIRPGRKTQVLGSMAFFAIAFILIDALFFNPTPTGALIAFEAEPVHSAFIFIRWGTILLGAITIFYIITKQDRIRHIGLVYYLPFAFFLISELIARAAFYASYYRIGV